MSPHTEDGVNQNAALRATSSSPPNAPDDACEDVNLTTSTRDTLRAASTEKHPGLPRHSNQPVKNPLECGLQLAKQYNCKNLLRPIIEFQPAAQSPPLAPKHMVAPTTGRPIWRAGTDGSVSNARTRNAGDGGEEPDAVHETMRGSEDGSMSPSPSRASSSSRASSPIRSSPQPTLPYRSPAHAPPSPSPDSRKRGKLPWRTQSDAHEDVSDPHPLPGANGW
ncbi:hypothetical protein EDB85DRAFT_2155177 [Lactarius pseudohatsudake]|nr:hypothetical protein EDB85DRAFT_2155177 [Lactarius pseudohatsudake]